MPLTISKTLSANDTGETGGHQAGLLIPKDPELLSFFPRLNSSHYNPRCHLSFTDDSSSRWEFAFIYYNNALFGGTRNEYRLTRMTRYIRESVLKIGDEIILSKDDNGKYGISYKRKNKVKMTVSGRLKLGSGWRIVSI